MRVKDLRELLSKIVKCHPEADEAEVWAGKGKKAIHPSSVAYDKKHKPARVKLEE